MTSLRRKLLGSVASAAVPIDISLASAVATDQDNGTTHTFTAVPIGAAAADRVVIVIATCRLADIDRTLNGCTIGGNAATAIVNAHDNSGGSRTAGVKIWALLVPTGTTATIVITCAVGNASNMTITVYRMVGTGGSVTAHDTATALNADPLAATIDVPAGGGIVGGACVSETNTSFTATGLTEDRDAVAESGLGTITAGHENYAAIQTGLAVNFNQAVANTYRAAAWASWGPA